MYKKIKNSSIKVLSSIWQNSSGAVAIIVGLCLIAFMIATALAIDVGSLFEDKRHLQTVADSAALAGAQELPGDPNGAIAKATEYMEKNYDQGADIYVEVGSYEGVPNTSISVTVINPDSPLYFARAIDRESTPVGTAAQAIVASPTEVNDLVPWGASLPPDTPLDEWLSPGQDKVLKFGADDPNEGNFYALNLSDDPVHGGGANEYLEYIREGYPGQLSVGDEIYTRTGNISKTVGATEDRCGPVETWSSFGDLVDYEPDGDIVLDKSSPQYVVVPVIYELEHPTGQDLVEILAFAPFILTEIRGSGGHAEIVGKFIDSALMTTTGGVGAYSGSGIKVIRLIK